MSYYRPDDTPDPLHEQLRALLGDRPFVVHLVDSTEVLGDGQAAAGVRTLVHDLAPLQVLVILNAFSRTMLDEVGRVQYHEHLVEHFREQLGVDNVDVNVDVDGVPLDEWVARARSASAERHAEVRDGLDDALGDALDREVAQDAAAVADEDGDRG